ncbi:MAG: hypothetical protein IKC35_03155 [Clostridia bacterium]|nr:hypothetical protein [Clostridia bacterium]
MKLIKERKINKTLLIFLLYLSFCFSSWYTAINTAASIKFLYPQFAALSNVFTAFLSGGIMPIIIYLLVVKFISHALKRTPFLPLDQMVYSLPFFYIGANIVCGLFNILYYFVPIASIWGNVIIPILSTTCFFVWFMVFICKNYVKNYNWKAMTLYFGRIYIVVVTIVTVFALVSEVAL